MRALPSNSRFLLERRNRRTLISIKLRFIEGIKYNFLLKFLMHFFQKVYRVWDSVPRS